MKGEINFKDAIYTYAYIYISAYVSTALKGLLAGHVKYNENHDESGRFSSGGGGGDEGSDSGSDGGGEDSSNGGGGGYREIDDVSAARDFGESMLDEGSLSSEEITSLQDYKSEGYAEINNYLRGGKDALSDMDLEDEINRKIADLDSAISKSSIPENITAFRGVDGSIFDGDMTGAEFTDDGFISTSLNSSKGMDFADNANQFGTPTVMQINVPAGTHGIYIDDPNISDARDEWEIVLPRGTSFHVSSDEEIGGYRFITVEVMK